MKTIPIHPDSAVTGSFFRSATKLYVTSIFRTIQGEGPYAGRPAVFVRLAGCNFGDKHDHCAFCDTAFSVGTARQLHYTDVLAEAVNLPGYDTSDIIVVTGGEPTLQPLLADLLKAAQYLFSEVQIETNGTQLTALTRLRTLLGSRLSLVVSPKASNRLGGYAPISRSLVALNPAFKFALSADPNDPHHHVPAELLDYAGDVYVSPIAVYLRAYDGEVSNAWDHTLIDAASTAKNYAYAAQYAMDNYLRLSIQTHLFTAIP